MLEVTVTDSGIGILENELKSIFTAFFQTTDIKSQLMNPNGNGLGLNISKQICTNLGGGITVSSMYGVGSSFTFSMQVFNVMFNQIRKTKSAK